MSANYRLNTRNRIIRQLPDTWTPEEVNAFLDKYGERLLAAPPDPEEIVQPDASVSSDAVDDTLGQPDLSNPYLESTLPLSANTRKGLTLDTYIILDGRSVPLRALWESGRLVPERAFVMEGTRKRPYRAVEYRVRITDYPRVITVTEETWKVVNIAFPNVHPADEEPSLKQIENIQASTTILKADELDGRKTHN